MFVFTGTFQFPELSWKIADFWSSLTFVNFLNVECYNDSILKRIYTIMPDQDVLLMGDYQHGMEYMKIRWVPWTADILINSITLTNFNELMIAARREAM